VFQALKRLLAERGLATSVGDEGGFAPDLEGTEAALALIVEAIDRAGHTGKVLLALDPVASGFCDGGNYTLASQHQTLDAEEMIDLYQQLLERYPIVSLEDGLGEDDWEGVGGR
jgi:enolase